MSEVFEFEYSNIKGFEYSNIRIFEYLFEHEYLVRTIVVRLIFLLDTYAARRTSWTLWFSRIDDISTLSLVFKAHFFMCDHSFIDLPTLS